MIKAETDGKVIAFSKIYRLIKVVSSWILSFTKCVFFTLEKQKNALMPKWL